MHVLRISVLPFVVALLIAAGCSKEKPAPEPAPDKDSTEVRKTPDKVTPPVEPVQPPIPTKSAIQLTELLHKDRAKAEKLYLTKVIAVEGAVAAMSRNSVKKTGSVTLMGYRPPPDPKAEGESLAFQVKCILKPEALIKVGLLAKKQMVRVTGRFASHSAGDITITDGDLEELTSGILPRLTATAITKKFIDKDPVVKDYLDKEVVITGTISDLLEKDGGYTVRLAGEGRTRVACALEEDEFKTLKKGDFVTINGEVSEFVSDELIVLLAFLANK
jgi:tRNA_anti-like